MLDDTAATYALRELDSVRSAIAEGRFAEAALRIGLLERDLAGRDATVVGIWQGLLAAERARFEEGEGVSRPA